MVRVTVEDAKRLIREASPLEAFVNVYVSPDGGIEARREECRAPYLEADFPGLLQSLVIVPRHKWRPHITQYAGGNDYDDMQYTVTRDEAQRVAEALGVSLDTAPVPGASAPAVAVPEPVAAPAEAVPVLEAARPPTVQQAIAPYVAKLMRERPDYSAEELYQRMRRDAGDDDSPFSRLVQGGELFCVEPGKPCGIATVRAALTAYRKSRSSTVEVPSNP